MALVGTAFAGDKFSSVDYLGNRIPLSRSYADFDEYKNDPKNLPANSVRRAEELLRAAKFGPEFSNESSLSQELERIQFPGYGSFYANQLGAHLDGSFELVYLEIPARDLNRYFAIEKTKDGTLRVAADFVAAAKPEITRVHLRNGKVSFESSKGAVISTKPYIPR